MYYIPIYDYFPFGMEVPNFGYKAEEYRYGFNGMEKDKEMKSKGKSIVIMKFKNRFKDIAYITENNTNNGL